MKSGAGGGSLAVVWGFLLVFAALCLWPTNGESEYGALAGGVSARGPAGGPAGERRRGSRCGREGLPVRGSEGVGSLCAFGGVCEGVGERGWGVPV